MTKFTKQIEQLKKAVDRLAEVLAEPKTNIVRDSAIKRFEITLDLAWKTTKSYLKEKEGIDCNSPRSCFREAFAQDLISYDEGWMQLVDLRNETVHAYDEAFADIVYAQLPKALELFQELLNGLSEK